MGFDGFDIPADLDTPVSAFLKLRPLAPRYLLESVEGGERVGRFSFLGFGDAEEIRLDGAPIDRLRAALERAPRLLPQLPGLPFAGGLVGAVGYRGERARFLAPRSVLVFDHVSRRAALLHAGSESDRRDLRAEVVRALHGAIGGTSSAPSVGEVAASTTRAAYLDGVGRAKEAIRAGEVFQLVLSIRFSAAFDGDPFSVYRAIRLLNPSPYTFFLRFSDAALVGSSPEALFRLAGREATLRPIAGTRPRGENEAADLVLERELLADPKEAAEHVMLVDLARNDLGRVAVPGSIAVRPSRSVERYSHVMHLVSGVTGVLAPGRDAFDVLASSFPAGTVTGAPKVRAMQLIDALEPCPRGYYAGSVGYFAHGGDADQAIAIRTIVVEGDRVSFQAGAGIVADSDPEREYEEVLAKSAVMRRALGPARGEAA